MGSFDVACSVSRITINPGDTVAYFPLEPYRHAYNLKAANNLLIYPWCYYVPICLPVFGEYADYGYINEIQKNGSTKVIEKHLDASIEHICGDEDGPVCPGMFVHREIYQTMVDNQINEWGEIEAVDEGYGSPWRKNLDKSYDDLRKAYQKYQKKLIEYKKKKKRTRNLEDDTVFVDLEIHKAEREFGFRDFDTFQKIYRPIIIKGWFKKEMADFMYFNISLNYTNVHYFPAQNGCQFGNHYGNLIVHQKSVEILTKKIKDEKNRAKYE